MRIASQPGLDGAANVVGAFNAAWNDHDLAAALALTSDDCVFEATSPTPDGQRYVGHAAIAAAWKPIFDDVTSRFTVEDSLARAALSGPTMKAPCGPTWKSCDGLRRTRLKPSAKRKTRPAAGPDQADIDSLLIMVEPFQAARLGPPQAALATLRRAVPALACLAGR
jgi:hypothetical protein